MRHRVGNSIPQRASRGKGRGGSVRRELLAAIAGGACSARQARGRGGRPRPTSQAGRVRRGDSMEQASDAYRGPRAALCWPLSAASGRGGAQARAGRAHSGQARMDPTETLVPCQRRVRSRNDSVFHSGESSRPALRLRRTVRESDAYGAPLFAGARSSGAVAYQGRDRASGPSRAIFPVISRGFARARLGLLGLRAAGSECASRPSDAATG